MILFEDEELEEYALSDGDIAVPIEIFLPADGGDLKITAYRAFADTAEAFEKLHGKSPFSPEALRFLAEKLNPAMEERDFVPSPDNRCGILEYRMDEESGLQASLILPDTRLIRCDAELRALPNATSQPLTVSEEGEEACAVHIVDGTVVACAAENDLCWEDDSVEIHVECAPAFRCRGFAASCAALLAQDLLRDGHPVRYLCRESNAASVRVAEKNGFAFKGTRYSHVCYRRGTI